MASVSHNLWLLAGIDSFFVNNFDVKHAFNVIKLNDYVMFDLALNNIKKIDCDPIYKIKNNERFSLNGFDYFQAEKNM